MLGFPIEDEFLVLDKAWFYQNKISNVDNERATPNGEFMALSQEIRFPFNNKLRLSVVSLILVALILSISVVSLRLVTDLINLSDQTEISH